MKRKKRHSYLILVGIRAVKEENRFLERESQLLSRIPSDWTVSFRRGKKQSCSMLQGLHVDTGFVEFRQLWEVGVFSYLI